LKKRQLNTIQNTSIEPRRLREGREGMYAMIRDGLRSLRDRMICPRTFRGWGSCLAHPRLMAGIPPGWLAPRQAGGLKAISRRLSAERATPPERTTPPRIKKPFRIARNGVLQPNRRLSAQASKDLPQPQDNRALGFFTLNPLPLRPSSKSTIAPFR
jgi:hypothetical protein